MDHEGKIRIVIAEENRILQEGICRMLAEHKCFEVLGIANNGIKAIDLVATLKPDILLLNIFLPQLNGVDAIPVIRKQCPETKILLLPGIAEDKVLLQAFRNGAKGYLPQTSCAMDLIKAIKMIKNGEMWIERKHFAEFFKEEMTNSADTHKHREDNNFSLTIREQEVLRLLIKGFSNKEIAEHLFISEKTVKTHLNKVFRKLNVTRRLEAVLFAIKTGIV